MIINSLLKEDAKLSWQYLIISGFKRKWQLELVLYFLIVVSCLICFGYSFFRPSSAPHFLWVTIFIAPLFIGRGLIRLYQFRDEIHKGLFIRYSDFLPTTEKQNIDELRIAMLSIVLKENNYKNKDAIQSIINELKFEAGLPQYQIKSVKILGSLFLLLLGAVIGYFMDVKPQNDSNYLQIGKALLELFWTIIGLLVVLCSGAWVIENTFAKVFFELKVRQRYRIDLIRSLEELLRRP